jgi:hypothetical protein
MDTVTLGALREHHPAWRLLAANNAPLIAAFLHQAFIEPNRRELAEPELIEALEDVLYDERQRNPGAYPKSAIAYLNDWASAEHGWLRKYYVTGSDDGHFDLTPATEKAIAWLSEMTERRFVGTESRLLTLVDLLRQMVEGTIADPETRLGLLRDRRARIDEQIAAVERGEVPTLDDTAIRDRFQQFTAMAADLLGDFREVEHNFRTLDREVREQIALWQGSKGELLAEIMGETDAITGSDQGSNFAAFWAFLMSAERQEELSSLLNQVLDLEPVADLDPDPRLRRVHHDWLAAGEHAQRTVAQLSKQLRRFIDDQAWLENRRIMVRRGPNATKSEPLRATS